MSFLLFISYFVSLYPHSLVLSIEYKTSNFFNADVGADVLDLAETMVASADGLVYEPVSLIHVISVVCFEEFFP